jgi:hypothetical protein
VEAADAIPGEVSLRSHRSKRRVSTTSSRGHQSLAMFLTQPAIGPIMSIREVGPGGCIMGVRHILRRLLRVTVRAVVLAALVLAVTACRGGEVAGKAAGAWGDDVVRALSRARGHATALDDVARGGRGVVDDAGRGLDDLARTAPQNRTAEQTRLLNQLLQTRAAIGLVGTAIGDANRVAAALPDDAARVAAATARLNVGDDLSRMSHQVLQDVACDAAAGFLFPSERDALEQAGHQRVVPDVVDAAGQSIVDYVFQELAGILGGAVARNAVAWQQYADGILEKGNQYAAGMQGVIQSPNWTVTRAYYYYVRLCLAIPG